MPETTPPLDALFRAFERASDSGDVPALLPQFADPFMVAGPQGAQCVRVADFALVILRRKQFFDSLGCRATTLVSLESSPLDTRFVVAKTRWRMTFALGEDQPRDVFADSTFIIDTSSDGYRIVFYLPHQDYMTMLRENGILPS